MKLQKAFGVILSFSLLAGSTIVTQASASGEISAETVTATDTSTAVPYFSTLSASPVADGITQNADGTASYLKDGQALTGLFSISPDYVKGDLNGSQSVEALDAAIILEAAAEAAAEHADPAEIISGSSGLFASSYEALQVADANDDGIIDSSDSADMLIYASMVGAGEEVMPMGFGLYFADEDGVLQKGWIHDGDKTYYGQENYTLLYGWHEIDGQRYYFTQDGILVNTGVTTISGKTYYFDQTAVFLTDTWVDLADGMHYFGEDGAMLTGLQQIGDTTYDLGTDGAMQTGWITADGGMRLAEENGAVVFGWYEEDSTSFYFDPDTGLMATGWYDIDGKTYYFGEDGVQATSDVEIDGVTYPIRDDGSFRRIKICIDAGHYDKYNHSPVNSAYWESDFTWTHHLLLVDALEDLGIEVVTTREVKEVDLDLEDRGRLSEGCDLFLSIHSNACNDSSVDAPLACCCIDGSVNDLGQQLADCVADVMQTNQGGTIWNRHGVKFPDLDYYGVLRGAAEVGTPGILLEHSYHTNLRATKWLMNEENLQNMAAEEADIIAAYFDAE